MSNRQQFVRVCECGCGQPTAIALSTRTMRGFAAGQPKPYLPKHRHFVTTGSATRRFWAKVVKSAGCWLWQGKLNENGYGVFSPHRGQYIYAHRYAYEEVIGPIPDGLVLDHVKARGCTSTACVNPAHLEPVTRKVNNQRGEGIASRNVRKTHCKRGHTFSVENTRIGKDGSRHCRTCQRILDSKRSHH